MLLQSDTFLIILSSISHRSSWFLHSLSDRQSVRYLEQLQQPRLDCPGLLVPKDRKCRARTEVLGGGGDGGDTRGCIHSLPE